mmetsp:Transcript_16344/g.51941  ORF Transcript_16344/g.51941 Transcript_16344/m.51941 type:complete len:340 (-) Transcript_16344:38-1057(-)|eukprot:CAMPEP_0196771508 /NCGR_PEP_ID=MMETSP1104-20130614/1724_1 /TAXON_ID=33652 /ORGANISM="Cafeteria sp., Strain Caron Lab Isolate" /LENGTH=339 /DNA_ID=CAMNT_0042141629 /DNA_START=39 /DNA_END=1058 /DNA_ORIENTATION=+
MSSESETCKAIVASEFGGPEVLVAKDIPRPRVSGPEDVAVQIFASGVNPVDTYIRSGSYAYKPTLPYVPGKDGAGIVTEVGTGVTQFRPGDRVYIVDSAAGTAATHAVIHASKCHALPRHLTFAEGAAIGVPYATAYRALFQRALAKPGRNVLIHGASGAVGIACVQLAHARGLTVFGTASSARGRELVKAQGAARVFDHSADGYLDEILEATGGRGVDVIVEMLSNVNLGADLRLLSRGGVVAVVGCRGPVEVNPRDLMAREASVVGVMLGGATEDDKREIFSALHVGFEAGLYKPVVGDLFPLERAADAHKAVLAHSGGAAGKVVLVVAEGAEEAAE